MKNFAIIGNKNFRNLFRENCGSSSIKIYAWDDNFLRQFSLFPIYQNDHQKTLEITLMKHKRLRKFLEKFKNEKDESLDTPGERKIVLLDTPEIRQFISYFVKITRNRCFIPSLHEHNFWIGENELRNCMQMLECNNPFGKMKLRKSNFQLELKGIRNIFFNLNTKKILANYLETTHEINRKVLCWSGNHVPNHNLKCYAISKKVLPDSGANKIHYIGKTLVRVHHSRSAPAVLTCSALCSTFRSKSRKSQVLLLNDEYFRRFQKIYAKISVKDQVDILHLFFENQIGKDDILVKLEQALINQNIKEENRKKDFFVVNYGYVKKTTHDMFSGNTCDKKTGLILTSDVPKFYFESLKKTIDNLKKNRRNSRNLLIVNDDLFHKPEGEPIKNYEKDTTLYLNSPVYRELGRKNIQSICKRQFSMKNSSTTEGTNPSSEIKGKYCEIPLENLIKAVADKKQKEYVMRSAINLGVFKETEEILNKIKILELPSSEKSIMEEKPHHSKHGENKQENIKSGISQCEELKEKMKTNELKRSEDRMNITQRTLENRLDQRQRRKNKTSLKNLVENEIISTKDIIPSLVVKNNKSLSSRNEKEFFNFSENSQKFQVLGIPSDYIVIQYEKKEKHQISTSECGFTHQNKVSNNSVKEIPNDQKPVKASNLVKEQENKNKKVFLKKSKIISNIPTRNGAVKKHESDFSPKITSTSSKVLEKRRQILKEKLSVSEKNSTSEKKSQRTTQGERKQSRNTKNEKQLDISTSEIDPKNCDIHNKIFKGIKKLERKNEKTSDSQNSHVVNSPGFESLKKDELSEVKVSSLKQSSRNTLYNTQNDGLKIKTKIPKLMRPSTPKTVFRGSVLEEPNETKTTMYDNPKNLIATSIPEKKINEKKEKTFLVKSSASSSLNKESKMLSTTTNKNEKREQKKTPYKKNMATFTCIDRKTVVTAPEKSMRPTAEEFLNVKTLKKEFNPNNDKLMTLKKESSKMRITQTNQSLLRKFSRTMMGKKIISKPVSERLNGGKPSTNLAKLKDDEKESKVEDEIETRLVVEKFLNSPPTKTRESSRELIKKCGMEVERIQLMTESDKKFQSIVKSTNERHFPLIVSVSAMNSSLIKLPDCDDTCCQNINQKYEEITKNGGSEEGSIPRDEDTNQNNREPNCKEIQIYKKKSENVEKNGESLSYKEEEKINNNRLKSSKENDEKKQTEIFYEKNPDNQKNLIIESSKTQLIDKQKPIECGILNEQKVPSEILEIKKETYSDLPNKQENVSQNFEIKNNTEEKLLQDHKSDKKITDSVSKFQDDTSKSSHNNVIILEPPSINVGKSEGSREGITKSFLKSIQDKMVGHTSKSRFKSENIPMSRSHAMKKLREFNVVIRRSCDKIAQKASSRFREVYQTKCSANESRTTNTMIQESFDKANQAKMKKFNGVKVKSTIEGKITSKIRALTRNSVYEKRKQKNKEREIEITKTSQKNIPESFLMSSKKESIGSLFADTVTTALVKCGKVDNILEKYSHSSEKCSVASTTDCDFQKIMEMAHNVKDKIKNTDIAISTDAEINANDVLINEKRRTLALNLQLDRNEDSVNQWNCNIAAVVTLKNSCPSVQTEKNQIDTPLLLEKGVIERAKFEESKDEPLNLNNDSGTDALQLNRPKNPEVYAVFNENKQKQKELTSNIKGINIRLSIEDIIRGNSNEAARREGSTLPPPELTSIVVDNEAGGGKREESEKNNSNEINETNLVKSSNISPRDASAIEMYSSNQEKSKDVQIFDTHSLNSRVLPSLQESDNGRHVESLQIEKDVVTTKHSKDLKNTPPILDSIEVCTSGHHQENSNQDYAVISGNLIDKTEVASTLKDNSETAVITEAKVADSKDNLIVKRDINNKEEVTRMSSISLNLKDAKPTVNNNETMRKQPFKEESGEDSPNSPDIFLTPLSSSTVFVESSEDVTGSKGLRESYNNKNSNSTPFFKSSLSNVNSFPKKIKRDVLSSNKESKVEDGERSAYGDLKKYFTSRMCLKEETLFGKTNDDRNKIEEKVENRIKQIDDEYTIPNMEVDVQKYLNNTIADGDLPQVSNEQFKAVFTGLERMGSCIVTNTTPSRSEGSTYIESASSVKKRKFATGENKFVEYLSSRFKREGVLENKVNSNEDNIESKINDEKIKIIPPNHKQTEKKIKRNRFYYDIVQKSEMENGKDRTSTNETAKSGSYNQQNVNEIIGRKTSTDYGKTEKTIGKNTVYHDIIKEKVIEDMKDKITTNENSKSSSNLQQNDNGNKELEKSPLMFLEKEVSQSSDVNHMEMNEKQKEESANFIQTNKVLKKFSEMTDNENPSIIHLRKNLKFDMKRKRLVEGITNKVSKRFSPYCSSGQENNKMTLVLSPSKDSYKPPSNKNEISYLKNYFQENRRKLVAVAARIMEKNQYLAFLLDLKSNKELRCYWWKVIQKGLASEVERQNHFSDNLKHGATENTMKNSLDIETTGPPKKCDQTAAKVGENREIRSRTDEVAQKISEQSEFAIFKTRKRRSFPKLKNQIFGQSKGDSGKRNLSIQRKESVSPTEQCPLSYSLMKYLENIDNLSQRTTNTKKSMPRCYEDDYTKSIEDITKNAREKFYDSMKFKLNDLNPKNLLLKKSHVQKNEETLCKDCDLKKQESLSRKSSEFGTLHKHNKRVTFDRTQKKLLTDSESDFEQKTAIVLPGREPIKVSLTSGLTFPKPKKSITANNPLKSLSDVLSNCNKPYLSSYIEDGKEVKYQKQNNQSKFLNEKVLEKKTGVKSTYSSVSLNDNNRGFKQKTTISLPTQRKYVDLQQTTLEKPKEFYVERIDENEPDNLNNKIEKIENANLKRNFDEPSAKKRILMTKSFSDFIKEDPQLLEKIRQSKSKSPPNTKLNINNIKEDPPRKFEYRFHDFRRRENKSLNFSMKMDEQKKRNVFTKFKGLIEARKNVYDKSRNGKCHDESDQTKPQVSSQILERINCFKNLQASLKINDGIIDGDSKSQGKSLERAKSNQIKGEGVRTRNGKLNENDLSTLIQEHPKTPETEVLRLKVVKENIMS